MTAGYTNFPNGVESAVGFLGPISGAVTGTAVAASTSLTVGAAGTAVTQMRVYSQALTPVSVAANITAEQTFTVTGLATTDKVFVNWAAATPAGVGIVGARVSATNTLALTYVNATAGALVPSAGTYTIVAIRS